MKIAAIMPCRGRAEQTMNNVSRLLATAGYSDWHLICAVDDDREVFEALSIAVDQKRLPTGQLLLRYIAAEHGRRAGYWHTLAHATELMPSATHLVNLANDLLPGQHWLRRAVAAYEQTFGDGPGMIGFNGDSHEVGHSCHFLISRRLLEDYGGWPVWYDHNFGDTELCQRAIADGLYAKAPWALLYHDHPYWGGKDDQVYAEGRARVNRDQALYEERRRRGWR